MSLTITAAQRDALYDQILDRLSGIGDIELAIQAENYDDAERIGRDYSDDLRLLLDDLGIGEGDGEPVELTTSPRCAAPSLAPAPAVGLELHSRLEAGDGRSPGGEVSGTAWCRRRVRPSWPISTAPRPAAGRAVFDSR